MNNALHIKLINLPHPYPFEPGSEIDIWGRIILFYLSEDQDVTIIDTQWDIGIFCEWIANNVNLLCNETLDPPDEEYILSDGSIAEMLAKMSEREFHEGEEDLELKWFDYLYDFDLHHNLWRS